MMRVVLALLYATLALAALGAAPLGRILPGVFGIAAGTLPGLPTAVAVAVAAMSVPCLLVGASFPLTVAAMREGSAHDATGTASAPRIYAWDAAGAIAGGAFTAAVTSLLALGGLSILWGRACRRRAFLAPGVLVTAVAAAALVVPGPRRGIEKATLGLAFPGEDVIAWEGAPDGRRVLTRSASGERNLYADGSLVASEVDESGAAEFAALAALMHPSPARVAALSWPGDPVPDELARLLPGAKVTASLSRLGGLARRFAAESSGVDHVAMDARAHLRSVRKADVIAYQAGMPEAFLSSRLVSVEAFGEAKAALAPGGVVAVRLPVASGYLNEGARKLVASVERAARMRFAHVRLEPLPHAGLVLLASDSPLADAEEIARRFAALARKPVAFRPALMGSGSERGFRLDALRDAVEGAAATPNRDFAPSAIWYAARVTGSMHGKEGLRAGLEPGAWWPAGAFVILVAAGCLVPAVMMGRAKSAHSPRALDAGAGVAFAAGAAGMLLEIAILCAYQVRCGALYGELSLLLALVMAGTGAGAWRGERAARELASGGSQAKLVAAAFALAPGVALALGIAFAPGMLVRPTLWFLAAGTGFVVGAAYPVALRVARADKAPSSGAGYVLGADLAGAGVAAALCGGVLVPVSGLGLTAAAGAAIAGTAVAAALLAGARARG
jgi:predicted membrane-bound spermidine synthase